MRAQYREEDILDQLDRCAQVATFPDFDVSYFGYAGARLTAYRDVAHWALILEKVGAFTEVDGHDTVCTTLHCFGNCLNDSVGSDPRYEFHLTRDGMEGPTFSRELDELVTFVHPDAMTIRLRGKPIWIEREPLRYEQLGIELLSPPRLHGFELVRALFEEHQHKILLHDHELDEMMWADLPKFLRLTEWHHPIEPMSQPPSQCETFQLIAAAMVAGDTAVYQPTLEPNTHWRHYQKHRRYLEGCMADFGL